MAGRLELLEDARIRPEMRSAIGEAYGGDPCADKPSSVLRRLCSAPSHAALRPAILRLLDGQGRVVSADTAERPLGDLAAVRLYGSMRRAYLFTVDLSAGIGSYSGPYTRLADPDSGGFGWLVADSAGVANDTITLVSTLKTAWRAVARADGRGQDLLMVLCRPDLAGPDTGDVRFTLTYERFTFDGRRWTLRRRQREGCYESGEPFPADSLFP
jgi:hypothetical protein